MLVANVYSLDNKLLLHREEKRDAARQRSDRRIQAGTRAVALVGRTRTRESGVARRLGNCSLAQFLLAGRAELFVPSPEPYRAAAMLSASAKSTRAGDNVADSKSNLRNTGTVRLRSKTNSRC